jgi:hypothetical protein
MALECTLVRIHHHESVCCALNRDVFFPDPGLGLGTSTARRPPDDSRTKLETGITAGGRVGRRDGGNDGESTTATCGAAPTPTPAGGGNDGESMIVIGAGAAGAVGRLRSNTVSLIGSGAPAAPSRGPSSFDARVRGGAAARTILNFESFCWRTGGVGAGIGAGGAGEAEGGAP